MPRTSQVELPGCPRFRAFCCDSLGLIKVIEAEGEAGAPKVVARWGNPDLRQGIRCLSLSSGSSPRLGVARKTNTVEILDPATGTLQSQLVIPRNSTDAPGRSNKEGNEGVCGLHVFSDGSSWGPAVLACTENGDTILQRLSTLGQDEGEDSQNRRDDYQLVAKWNVSQTGNLLCMAIDGGEQHSVYGGKGVDVNVWDLGKKTKLWTGKTPHRDNLGLISPAWVTAVTFLSKDDHRKIVVGTGHHQVRLYDVGAQRRPVLSFDYGESPIMTVTEDPDGNSVYVGTGSGDLACFDLRTGKLVGGFKGKCAGSIRSVVRHPVLPLIASCGLDRYLRIHNTTTRQLLGSLFLKQQLVSVVFEFGNDMSTKASTLKSGIAGSQELISEQAGGDLSGVGTKKLRPSEERMKVKRAHVEHKATLDGVTEEERSGMAKDKLRCPAKELKMNRGNGEHKASKLRAKRQKVGS